MYVFFDIFFLCFLGIGKGANVLREAEAEAEAGGVAGNKAVKAVMDEDEGGESLDEEESAHHGASHGG